MQPLRALTYFLLSADILTMVAAADGIDVKATKGSHLPQALADAVREALALPEAGDDGPVDIARLGMADVLRKLGGQGAVLEYPCAQRLHQYFARFVWLLTIQARTGGEDWIDGCGCGCAPDGSRRVGPLHELPQELEDAVLETLSAASPPLDHIPGAVFDEPRCHAVLCGDSTHPLHVRRNGRAARPSTTQPPAP